MSILVINNELALRGESVQKRKRERNEMHVHSFVRAFRVPAAVGHYDTVPCDTVQFTRYYFEHCDPSDGRLRPSKYGKIRFTTGCYRVR